MWEDSVEAKLQLTQAINMQSIKKNTQIGNCIVNRCNEEWSSLDKTEDPAIRYCQKCKVNVYYCSTASQLVQYEIDGKHVAFDLREFGAIEIQRLVQYLADYRLFRGTSSGFERALEHNLILPSYWHADIFRKLIDGALDIALDAFGNLVIDTFQPRGDSLSACRYVIEPWENGLQCKRWLEGIWSTVDDISVGMVVDWGGRTRFKCISIRFAVADVWFQAFPQDDFPLCVFVRSIPPEVVNNVGRMKSHQLALLQWVAKDSRAYEMLHSVPILLWLLYDARRRSESDNDFIHKEEVLDLKRKEIFELIFGWGTKSAIKVLSRVKLELGAEPEMTRIREFFAVSENLNYVRHLQSISVNLVKLVQDYGAGVKSVFYRQFFSNNCRRSWRALFSDPGIWSTIEDYERLRSDSRSMIRTLGLGQPALSKWRRLGEVGSLQKIREFHDKLVKKSNLQEAQKRGQQLSEQLGEYPLPPLPQRSL